MHERSQAIEESRGSNGRGKSPYPPILRQIAGFPIWAQLRQPLLLSGGGAFATVFALRVVGRIDQSLLLWPVTGMVLALLLPRWTGRWKKDARLGAMAALGVLTGGLLVGQPWWLSLSIASLTCLDLFMGRVLLAPILRRFDDLKTHSNMLRFVATVVIAPSITGVLGAFPVSRFLHAPFWQTAATSMLANSLGIAVVLPAVLFLADGDHRSLRGLFSSGGKAILSPVFFAAVASLAFWQNRGPFLFVVFPPMIIVLLTLGLEGAVFTAVTLSTIGWIATLHGHGPIMLMHDASPAFRLLVLQIFVWVSLATALPVGALLDERRRAEKLAIESQSIYQTLLQNTRDTIVLSSLDGSRRYVSPTIKNLTGWTPEEYLAMNRRDTVYPEDWDLAVMIQDSLAEGKREHTMRYRMMQKDAGWKWVEANVRAYGVNEIAGYVGTLRDISAIKENEDTLEREIHVLTEEKQKMAQLAQTDPLTGLMNRRGLDETFRRQQSFQRDKLAVLMIDVDYFKLFNDSYGHLTGDQCLIRLADVLRAQAARSGDLVVRLGGEEFAVLLPGADVAGGLRVADEIRKALALLDVPHVGSPLGRVSVSMGVSAKPPSLDVEVNMIMAQADRALYASKRSGKDRATAYEPKLELISA